MICEIICVAGFLCMSNLDIVHISSAYVHVICILSEHMRIMHILSAVVLHMFFPNRQCQCDLYVISTTLYRSYDVQLSFHTIFTQTHIVNAIYMLYAHIHIICYVSFTFLIYLITCNLVSAYCLHTHMSSAHHLYVICTATHGQHGPELSFYCDRNLLLNGICGQECWIFPFQDYVNDLRDNLCCWFSLHVTSGHCSHLICMCTYHLHIIWAYVYYADIICTSPSYVPS